MVLELASCGVGRTGVNTPGAKPGAPPDVEGSTGCGTAAAERGKPEPGGTSRDITAAHRTDAKDRVAIGFLRWLFLFHI